MQGAKGQDPALQGLDVYIVGGAVRDALLGRPAGDRDWVVVGATPEQMAERGFIPVGGDFPVFLHPRSKEEYALARTERKSGRGYKGFTFHTGTDVTLEQDLQRRDLTVNAIAQAADGRIIDPLNGCDDVKARVLRHVGEAFCEDPVRLLRLARFAARFHDFSIAPETLALARRLVQDGEVDALVPERVWQEVVKGLMTERPARMFEVLAQTGALERVMPDLVFDTEIAAQLHCAVQAHLSLAQRFALLCHKTPSPEQLGRHVRAPSECVDYAKLLPVLMQALAEYDDEVDTSLDIIERMDGLRKPQRLLDLLNAAVCILPVDVARWQRHLDAVRSVDAGAVAKAAGGKPDQIKAALRLARREALMRACG
ncbi:TetR/AcrR family transcriptional regulator C-terminal domain-containing protein [Pusillimonas sp. CC-YST705]|uniref:TetR/AcrR family transcriptional regulator C-terminal domain-containing protein n=1 Tax=Mesopusillimonas faecipullorum TaxID=2755040 RepID=A0ABS8CDV8_9BURK|nr:TetR/AcrR family transcriptional regulator C-terminal domain-containing protein [Mesopusillimonas faecipullorum]